MKIIGDKLANDKALISKLESGVVTLDKQKTDALTLADNMKQIAALTTKNACKTLSPDNPKVCEEQVNRDMAETTCKNSNNLGYEDFDTCTNTLIESILSTSNSDASI